MYYKKLHVRWGDLDANGHMAHSSYQKFTAHVRISLIHDKGLDLVELVKKGIGSILFYEQIYYFREFLPMETAYITLEIAGFSKDGQFFKFHHNFYKKNGVHAAHSEVLGSWINLRERNLINPPEKILQIMKGLTYTKDFKILTKEDSRVGGVRPQDIDFQFR
ncbi:MAG: acyl-CoA thioesterase [Flavobacteriales bacterium AspAUS03]